MNEEIFSGVGEIYSKFRPTYPNSFLKYLHLEIGVTEISSIADIGSGTGILSEKLLNNCYRVYAIEPNNDMRKVAETNLLNQRGFISVNGSAEKTTLQDLSVDFITAAQSFHWFDRQLFKKECKRILKTSGKVILLWNSRDETNEIVWKIDLINKKYCNNFSGSSKGLRGAISSHDFKDFFDGAYETRSFRNNLIFTEQTFIGLHESASYRLEKDDPNYSDYINALRDFFKENSQKGQLVLSNFTRSYVGRV